MATETLVTLVLLAVLGLWAVGAYNRLMSHRLRISQAWVKVQETLLARGAVVLPLVQGLQAPLAGEQGALERWALDHERMRTAANAAPALPLDVQRAAAWADAEAALAASSSRVLALMEQQPDLLHPQMASLRDTWLQGQARLPFVRQNCNDAVQAYNDALQQAPTRWLAQLFRLAPAGKV
jgi:LemA protein